MADRRARILELAARRFAEFGFEATTVREIADDADILSGSLYHHFATKEDMLHEIVRDTVLMMGANAGRIAEAELDAEHKLAALIIFDLTEMTRNQGVHAILYNERKFFRRREDFSYVVEAKRAGYVAWGRILEQGIRANQFKPDLDFYLTISTIVRMLNAAADWYKSEDSSFAGVIGPYTLDQVIDFHLEFILRAVRAPARASEPVPRAACEALARRVEG